MYFSPPYYYKYQDDARKDYIEIILYNENNNKYNGKIAIFSNLFRKRSIPVNMIKMELRQDILIIPFP